MFLNYIKAFSVKRILKNSLQNDRRNPDSSTVRTIGVVVEESSLEIVEQLIKRFREQGIANQDIVVIVYRDKVKKGSAVSYPLFSARDLNWNATFSSTNVNDFIVTDFDLLISYYDVEKAGLLLLTNQSNAKFKVGLASVDKRLNDLIINTTVDNHVVFTQEIVKYLKILNKL
ncbi:hypothetical protein H8R23_14995 [Flavobacterium sp. F-380]|uniref:Uncharacterized protein n=2 Tax=Flavobacterium kayseriense TaxID=2764714 RepID=A0ABR7JB09_9FLAO|nr:hypothetical protein [Flavobacterium kayseriense]MBC5849248.1 hypothetical protein [Flavobacterium kayseriense]MBU0941171.1 hypothetical protein [Bacteroidota bacterium]